MNIFVCFLAIIAGILVGMGIIRLSDYVNIGWGEEG